MLEKAGTCVFKSTAFFDKKPVNPVPIFGIIKKEELRKGEQRWGIDEEQNW